MMIRSPRFIPAVVLALLAISPSLAVPIPADRKEAPVADATSLIPSRKHLPVPGKIIAVLVADGQPVLSTEGRSGPADQLVVGWSGGSYRWVYVPTDGMAIITNLSVPLPEGKTKVYPKLNMASPTTVKQLGIATPYSLVEIEVNDGAGSPAGDSFVATRMKPVDGTKEYPLKVAEVVERLKKEYANRLTERQKDLDGSMIAAARKAINGRDPTGPRESSTLTFMTWLPEQEKLSVRFLTRITDGEYKYVNGIRVELTDPLPPEAPAKGGALPPRRLENGLRHGTQFGIETGIECLVNKDGKVDAVRVLEPKEFTKELPPPPVLRKGPPRETVVE